LWLFGSEGPSTETASVFFADFFEALPVMMTTVFPMVVPIDYWYLRIVERIINVPIKIIQLNNEFGI
jgi:hypothetical protein